MSVPARRPAAHGPPVLAGRIRGRPEDFRVVEELGFEPEGAGPHLWLRLRKRDANTGWLARRLAGLAGVPAREVGYSGLKDRHAVTEQWFSLPAAGSPGAETLGPALGELGVELLEHCLHRRKLRRGSHAANRFRILVSEAAGPRADVETRLTAMRERGVPNYFGAQRFGRDGGNLELAARLARGERLARGRRGYALSAARAEIFNRVLARRVETGSWDRLQAGDVAGLAGSRSVFPVRADDLPGLERRVLDLDLHPTGPLWGRGRLMSGGPVRVLEEAVAGDLPGLATALEAAGLEQARRHLRLLPEGLGWRWRDAGLELEFRLPPGAFATTVLAELGDLREAGR